MSRIQTRAAAVILGIKPRTVQGLAAQGALPGAAKIGKSWTFDPQKLYRFIAAQESECQKTTFTDGAEFGGSERPLKGLSVARAYEQTMLKLRGGCATPGSPSSGRKPRGTRSQ